MVDEAFTYPFTADTKRDYLIILAVLVFSWLLFPLVIIFAQQSLQSHKATEHSRKT